MLPEAAADEHVRLFLDGGPLVHALLQDVSASAQHEFLELVLCAWAAVRPPHVPAAQSGEQLTQRELEIVRYLPSRLSTFEIAEKVYVSRNTLKTHLRNIYRKLEVTNRDEAVAAAERLGLD